MWKYQCAREMCGCVMDHIEAAWGSRLLERAWTNPLGGLQHGGVALLLVLQLRLTELHTDNQFSVGENTILNADIQHGWLIALSITITINHSASYSLRVTRPLTLIHTTCTLAPNRISHLFGFDGVGVVDSVVHVPWRGRINKHEYKINATFHASDKISPVHFNN